MLHESKKENDTERRDGSYKIDKAFSHRTNTALFKSGAAQRHQFYFLAQNMLAVATHYAGSATRNIRTVFYFGQTWTFPMIDLSGGNLRGSRDMRRPTPPSSWPPAFCGLQ